MALLIPLVIAAGMTAVTEVPFLASMLDSEPASLRSATFYLGALIPSPSQAFLRSHPCSDSSSSRTVPRLLNLAITPDRVYRLYGFHYSVQRAITRTTNSKFFVFLLGDSSYIVGYLLALGYDLGEVQQTGVELRYQNTSTTRRT